MAPAEPIARHLARWVTELDLGQVPDGALQAARRSIVDTIGVAIAGSKAPAARKVRAHAERHYPGSGATILGTETRVSPVGAALANGMAAHVLDFDDTSYAGIIHGSTVILPAVLAAAEQRGAPGAAMLKGFLAGSEVAYAVGLTATTSHYMKGWWASGTCGIIGAAAGAGSVFGLNTDAMADAIGMAAVQACGMVAVLGTDAKPLLAGRNAMAGLECAALAAEGFSGPHEAFEDRRGFLALMNDGGCDPEGLAALGRVWRLVDPGILFKRYPLCSATQAAGEMTERLIAEHGLKIEDIAEVICEVTHLVAISLVYDRPRIPSEAQFSMPFALGAIIADGRVGPEHLDRERLADPRLRAAMELVTMREAPDLATPEMRARYPEGARVTIVTKAGARHSGFLGASTGMPETPLSDAALSEKFRNCARFAGWEAARTEKLLAALWSLESAGGITPLLGGPRHGE